MRCVAGSIAGSTLASITPSSSFATASSLILYPSSFANAMSMGSIPEMPPRAYIAHGKGVAEGETREYAELVAGVQPLDVEGRVGLRKTGRLRVLEGTVERDAFFAHLAQDVVARAVQDAEEIVDPVPHEAVPYRPYHRDAPAHGGLEAYLAPGFRRQIEYLVAFFGQEGLIRRHHPLALLQGGRDQIEGIPRAPYQLDNDIYRRIIDKLRCAAEKAGVVLRQPFSPLRVDFRGPGQDYVQPGLLRDERTVFPEYAIRAPAHRAKTYDAYPDHRFFSASTLRMPFTACLILCSFSMRANLT